MYFCQQIQHTYFCYILFFQCAIINDQPNPYFSGTCVNSVRVNFVYVSMYRFIFVDLGSKGGSNAKEVIREEVMRKQSCRTKICGIKECEFGPKFTFFYSSLLNHSHNLYSYNFTFLRNFGSCAIFYSAFIKFQIAFFPMYFSSFQRNLKLPWQSYPRQ